MKILAIDTAFNACSVAVLDTCKDECYSNSIAIERGHAEKLVPMVLELLSSSGLEMRDIDKIAVTIGPGAFTGMRVGISTAKAYGLALGKSVIGINSFEAMLETYLAQHDARYDAYAMILETKRDDYFFCVLDEKGEQIATPQCCSGDHIHAALGDVSGSIILIGDATERFTQEAAQNNYTVIHDYVVISHPDIIRIARKAQNIIEKSDSIPEIVPLYLREADVTLPKKPSHYLKIN